MQITVQQAIYGEVNGAWDLLGTSLRNNAVAKKIRFQTDLQDRPPSGIIWQPVVRGFAVDEFYVVTKTYLDNSPSVRAGRVFSHSLIIEKCNLGSINNLKLLFSQFSETIDKSILLKSIDYPGNPEDDCSVVNEMIPRFNKLIHGIAEASQYQNVIVWVGQEHFDSVVCAVWGKLSKFERESFSFGINFNPNEVPKANLTLVTTPASLENKWVNTEFCIIKKNDAYQLTSFFELYLSGDAEASKKLNDFIKEIEASPFERGDLAFLSKGVSAYENIDSTVDFNSINTLYQIVSEYSPNRKKGVGFKQKLLSKLCEIIKTSTEKEILALKNIKTTAFEDSETKLASSFQIWIKNNLLTLKTNKENNYSKIIKQYKSELVSDWWNSTLHTDLKKFVSDINSEKSEIIWQWVLNDVSLLELLGDDLDNSQHCETALVMKFPKQANSDWLSKIKKFALEKNWLRLYATSLIKEFDFQRALSEQLKVDKNKKYVDGINVIVSAAKPRQLINFTVINGDSRLLNICGELCLDDSSLLNKLEVQNSNWRHIWLDSIKRGNTIDKGIVRAKPKMFEVLDLVFNGIEVEEELLEEISSSDYANILEYKNRSQIWKELPLSIRENFLSKTATELLNKLSKNPAIEIPDDDFLEDYIIKNGISNFLYFNKEDFKKTLPIFLKFTKLSERVLEDYVYCYRGKLDLVDATQLGQLVKERDYKQVAKAIYERMDRDSAYKIALSECYHLLSLYNQGYLKLTGSLNNISFSEDKWWESFQETVCNLYSSPKERKIWIEAGGDEYDLLSYGTGKEQWVDALQKLRNGAYENITIEKLLKKMLKEHSKYEPLKLLQKLRNKL